jgi:hypothetical protein
MSEERKKYKTFRVEITYTVEEGDEEFTLATERTAWRNTAIGDTDGLPLKGSPRVKVVEVK